MHPPAPDRGTAIVSTSWTSVGGPSPWLKFLMSYRKRAQLDVELDVVGPRIRALRTDAGLTLADLGKAAGYTAGYISQVEKGTTLPSLTALSTLASALGVEMTVLIEPEDSRRAIITRAGEEHELHLVGGATYLIHGEMGSGRAFSAMSHNMPHANKSFRHYGERFFVVLEGSVEITFGDKTYHLDKGDTVHYGAYQEHVVTADEGETASVFIVTAPAIL